MLVASSSVLIIVWNISTAVIYFSLAGSPYKSDDHYRKTRKVWIIAAVWTVAFAIKFTSSFFGDKFYDLNINNESNFGSAAFLAGFVLITEILPLFLVVDGNFVKVFSCEHIEQEADDTSLLIAHVSADTIQGNSMIESLLEPVSKAEALDAKASSDKVQNHSPLLASDSGSFLKNPRSEGSDKPHALSEAQSLKLVRDSVDLLVTKMSLKDLDEGRSQKLQNTLAIKLTITKANKALEKQKPFVLDWYPVDEKFRKSKLGSLFECKY